MVHQFASNLLSLRLERRLTQNYMAIHCGMSQPNYSDIERGKTNPSIIQLEKFAEVLETTVCELISGATGNKETRTNAAHARGEENQKDAYIRHLEKKLEELKISYNAVNESS